MVVMFTLRLQRAFAAYVHDCIDTNAIDLWLQYFSAELVMFFLPCPLFFPLIYIDASTTVGSGNFNILSGIPVYRRLHHSFAHPSLLHGDLLDIHLVGCVRRDTTSMARERAGPSHTAGATTSFLLVAVAFR